MLSSARGGVDGAARLHLPLVFRDVSTLNNKQLVTM